jgi:hypothetical protein
LYFLHQGRVQFLASDYRARLIEAHGPGFFPKKAPGPGTNRPPSLIQDVLVPAPKPEQARDDPSKEEGEDEEESMNSKDSSSSPHYSSGGEEDKASTPVPSSTQMKAARSQMGTSTPSETTEAAGFGSDTSPRTESGDNEELGRAGPN